MNRREFLQAALLTLGATTIPEPVFAGIEDWPDPDSPGQARYYLSDFICNGGSGLYSGARKLLDIDCRIYHFAAAPGLEPSFVASEPLHVYPDSTWNAILMDQQGKFWSATSGSLTLTPLNSYE